MMAQAIDVETLEPQTIVMTPEESWAFFDDKARTLLGISGEEFLRRLSAGDYDDTLDDPNQSDLMYLALLGSNGRS